MTKHYPSEPVIKKGRLICKKCGKPIVKDEDVYGNATYRHE